MDRGTRNLTVPTGVILPLLLVLAAGTPAGCLDGDARSVGERPPATLTLGALRTAPAADGIDTLVFGPAPIAQEAQLAFDGRHFFASWLDQRVPQGVVAVARVTTAGALLDPENIVRPPAVKSAKSARIACHDGICLLVWGEGNITIHGARIDREGTLLDPQGFELSRGFADADYVALVFDGAAFMAVWPQIAPPGPGGLVAAHIPLRGPLPAATTQQLVLEI